MIDTGSTGFMMICSSYVFFMTPGLAFFYGGLCRRKNVVNTMMSSIFIMGLASVLWVAIGYSLSFGGNVGGIIGTFQNAFLNGVGWEPGAYSDFCCVPNDVCDYHTGTAHRLGRRQNEFQSPVFVHYSVVTGCVLSAGAHGMGRERLLGGNRFG